MGFLPPRLTQQERDAIPTALRTPGLLIYNKTTNCMEFWNGSQWISMCSSTAICQSPPAPTASSNSPVCTGENIQLSASNVTGATYVWTGPDGFYSTSQNPTISNATAAKAGTYCVKVYVAGCWSDAACTEVSVIQPPGTWTQKAPFTGSPPRHASAFFALGDTIFVINGRRSDVACCQVASGCYRYRIAANVWESISCPEYCSGVYDASHQYGFSYGGYGYVAGGGDMPCDLLRRTWRYDRVNNTWSIVSTADLPWRMYAAHTHGEIVGGYFYMFGGDKELPCPQMLNTILRFDPNAQTWSQINTFTNDDSRRAGLMFVLPFGNDIYFGGGGYWTCPQGCCGSHLYWYKYDIATNQVQPMSPNLPTSLYNPAVVIGGYGYVPKKESGRLYLYRLEPATATWTKICTPMKDQPDVVIRVNNKVYLIDTNDDSGDGIREHWEWEP